jgi:hypothetical protein
LPSGKVLVAGGNGSGGRLFSAEVYDPATGVWSPTGSLAIARTCHTATLLPSGKVLVAGGYVGIAAPHSSAEVYDPATGVWSPTGSLVTARAYHTATLLPSGKVLVAGGYGSGDPLFSAEVYDPAMGVWSPTGSLATARTYHTATLLPSGKVLVAGGYGSGDPLFSAEVYDPATGVWSPTGSLATARESHTATLLPSGKVMVAGSNVGIGAPLSSAEVYDPATGVWSPTGSLVTARAYHTATPLPSDKVLVAGGYSGTGGPLSNAEVYGDITAPAAPAVLAPANGSATSDSTPAYSGMAEPDSTVTVFVDGTVVGTTTTGATAHWSLTPAAPLTDGLHMVKASATDRAGNTSLESNTNTFAVDATPPPVPVVLTPANGSISNNNTPSYSGVAEADSTVTVIVDGATLGTTLASASGEWSFPQPTALADGSHMVRARATDAVGNTSPESPPQTFMVDATLPATPVVLTPANGSTSNDNTPAYSGVAEAGSTVTVIVDGAMVGTTTANASGHWFLTQPTALADGSHTVRARAMDAAGNPSLESNPQTFTVDATPPAAPMVLTPANGSTSTDHTPTYSGTAEPGSTVTVIVNGGVVGIVLADASGNWSFTQPTALADGIHRVKARATDAAGNPSPESDAHTFTVDTAPPAAPVVLTPANGSTTSNNRPTYSGTAEPGSHVTVIVDGGTVGASTTNASGAWSFTQPTALANGIHAVKARATDVSGDTSPESNTHTFTVDTTPPAAPVVLTPADGSTTNNNRPTYSGTAEPGSNVTIMVDGGVVGTTTANASGEWIFTQQTALGDGNHAVKARATDAAGNPSPESNTHTFMVDAMPPAAPVLLTPADGSIINDNTPAYSGVAEAGSTVTVIVDEGVVGITTASASGEWFFTQPTALAGGSHKVNARARDAAGNTSPESSANTFIVDTTPPAAPVVLMPTNGSTINNNRPTYSGTAEPGSTVTIIVDGEAIGTTAASSSGDWNFTQPATLADGIHRVKARATDAVGNPSPESNTHTFTVDTAPPAVPVVLTPANGSTTTQNRPTYSGTAEPGSNVTVIVDGEVVGMTTASASGEWFLTQPTALGDGSHAVKARAMDAVGNPSPESNTHTFTIDTAPPAAPVLLTPANGSTTNNNRPAYSGTAEPGSTVTIIVNGGEVGMTTVNASGEWFLTQPTALAEGIHRVKARARDAVGNTSPESSANTFTVDTTPSTAPVVLAPANGSTGNDNTPTYNGTAEPGSTVTVIVNGAVMGTATANASGEWNFTQPTALADGNYTVRSRATDGAGNTGTISDPHTFAVDTTPPAVPIVNMPADGSTTSNKPTYSGTAEPNNTVTVIVDGAVVGTTTAHASGEWSFLQLALAPGDHTIKVRATDVAGNSSNGLSTHTFTVDTTPPAKPMVITPANSSTIKSNQPTYSGTAEEDSTVTVIVDGVEVGTTKANASGEWSFLQPAALADGNHTAKAHAKDVAGNSSGDSVTHIFTVDTTPLVQKSHYGWNCATAPAFPATWALLALHLLFSRRRLKSR